MDCFLCRFLRRSIDRATPGWTEAAERDMRGSLTRGIDADGLFKREADPERLRSAFDLWGADPARAFSGFLDLARGGSVWSMLQIGWAYEVGRGTRADLRQADEWYRRAAKGGSDEALLRVGWLAFLRRDAVSAEDALNVGVERGSTPAMRYLAQVKLTFDRTSRGRTAARALLDRACAGGDRMACLDLAKAMAHGRFGPKHILAGWRSTLRLTGEFVEEVERSIKLKS